MMAEVVDMGAERVLVCNGDGPLIDAEARATDLVGDALGVGASMIAVPTACLAPAFFQLRTGLAGAVAQKVVNYRMRLAVVGDISAEVAASDALRDWVVESNRRGEVLFVADLADLAARLGGASGT